MKQKKKNDIAALLDYAGSRRGLTFSGPRPVGGVHGVQHDPLPLHLAGGPGSDRSCSKLDAGPERRPVRVAGLRGCLRGHRAVLRGADVYSPGGFPHGGQHPQAGRGPCDERPSGLVRRQRLRPHPGTAGRGGGRHRDPAGPQSGRHRGYHHPVYCHAGADVRL